jgi:hypothetical protein
LKEENLGYAYLRFQVEILKYLLISFTEPFTEILGGKDVFIDQHSALNLTCVVHAPEPPAHIFWIHDGQVSLLYTRNQALWA